MHRRRPGRACLCPQAELHFPGVTEGYIARQAWAEQMMKTHRQRRCPGCGLYKIWVPKEEAKG
jgi:hypothetical protein